jgi:hypothetical protein
MSNQFEERLKKIAKRNRKVVHKKGFPWPIEKKIEVVSQFLVLGNMRIVAAATGVDYDLCRAWKTQPWWKELEMEIRQTQNIELDTKLSQIVERSIDATMDRIENGDFIYDQKSGEMRRKPVALRDVAKVANDMLTKRELIRGNATERKETTTASITSQLDMLKAEFARMQNIRTVDVPMVEIVENEDAVHEEREEGLQEGSSSLYLEAGSEEEASGAERSSSGNGSSGESTQG